MELPGIRTDEALLKKFTRKQLLISIISNVIINGVVPYINFEDKHAVHLFKGAQPLARFILPMAVFLPFFITLDVLKKTIALIEGNNASLPFSPHFPKNKFLFKTAGLNATVTLSTMLCLMLGLHVSLPDNYTFDGTVLAIVSGLLGGAMAVIFVLQPISKVKKLYPA
ncbi:hypothetical protein SAMN05518672_11024 [Chitinophaga sp. CF118]|uniref:hypothetical protein n=1 Tax=Chitinophaga sp. CF118 TaxID=1884367 RepID=UPI0008E17816|nr:hypothetical protein [Chitinophaga sp. CF118]SFE76893.1 hypothetical protein SAMN05518672_11024 [Chitinophaga sp. CF118]